MMDNVQSAKFLTSLFFSRKCSAFLTANISAFVVQYASVCKYTPPEGGAVHCYRNAKYLSALLCF